jgi:serine/threonine protein kinase
MRLSDRDSYRLISRIKEISRITVEPPIEVLTDTSKYDMIHRGQVIQLEGQEFLVSGNVYEHRFGLEGMPKLWVRRGYDLSRGQRVIIKFEFHEELEARLGSIIVRSYRNPRKEGEVLSLVRGDSRFMQGRSYSDDSGNCVRVMDFIGGKNMHEEIIETEIGHGQYYYTRLHAILRKLVGCCEGIQMLHDSFLCHGDVRSDHILIDEETGEFRWIDFDLRQHFEGYDLWFLGIVLHFIVGLGMNSIHYIRNSGMFPTEFLSSLPPTDTSMYYPDRLMNLRKIYPYLDRGLNDILMHFAFRAEKRYSTVAELVQDLKRILPVLPKDSSY